MNKKKVSLSVSRGEKSKKGGLTAKGRKKYNSQTGSKLKAPVTGTVKPNSKDAKRRKSFCARSSAWIPEGGCAGKKTRGCLARKRWKCK